MFVLYFHYDHIHNASFIIILFIYDWTQTKTQNEKNLWRKKQWGASETKKKKCDSNSQLFSSLFSADYIYLHLRPLKHIDATANMLMVM